jgi:uncharacterized protein (DUF2141 family)
MKFWSLIICVFLCHAGHVPAKTQKPAGSSELTVRVKSFTGLVEGATVVLTSKVAGQRVNVTNAEGVCEFRGLQAGVYSLQIVQRSFFPTEESQERMDHVEIRSDAAYAVNVHLVKGALLKGRIVSIEGAPVIGIPISALNLDGKKPSLPSMKESNATAVSDDRGEFRIYGLRPGRYTVAVNAQRNSLSLKSVATLFYPGERECANATAFELASGQEVSIPDMILDLTSANQNSLLGMVKGADGKPLRGVSLSLLSVDGSQVSDSSVSDDHGRFSFEGLPAGQYLLKAKFNSGSYSNLERRISIMDQATNNVVLELRRQPLISDHAFPRNRTLASLASFCSMAKTLQTER